METDTSSSSSDRETSNSAAVISPNSQPTTLPPTPPLSDPSSNRKDAVDNEGQGSSGSPHDGNEECLPASPALKEAHHSSVDAVKSDTNQSTDVPENGHKGEISNGKCGSPTGPDEIKSDKSALDSTDMIVEKNAASVTTYNETCDSSKIPSTTAEAGTNSKSLSPSSSSDAQNKTSDKSVKYRCPKCARVIKDKRLVDNHSCDIEAEDEKVKITITQDKNTKSFTCKECDFSSSGHGFEEHLMCHLMIRPYQCLYCKECFINRKEISRHVHKTHNGAKMSCALRALRKAKALIKEVTTAGVISFMAKVAGKVPLEKDPEKRKDGAQNNDQKDKTESGPAAMDSIDNCDNAEVKEVKTDPVIDKKKIAVDESTDDKHMPSDGLTGNKEANIKPLNDKMDDKSNEDKKISHTKCDNTNLSNSKVTVKKGEASDSEMVKTGEGSDSNSQQEQSGVGFSKLRQVLTFGASEQNLANSKEADFSRMKDSESVSVEESGLKIVASYSLSDGDDQEMGRAQEKASISCPDGSVEPNFIMEPPSDKNQEPEVLSFLGPEQPLYKNEPSSLMLPPPPLQPAPSHLHSSTPFQAGQQKPAKDTNFFICGFNCLFSSMSTSEFREHTINFHSSETFFPCFYCGHRSPNENDLVRHISNHTQTHNKSSPLYVCGNDGCRFGTNMVSDYVSHIKVSHPEILEPLCYSCGITFPDLPMLQSHVEENVIHSINCPHCPSKATERRSILDHITSAHPGKAKLVSVAKQLICNDRKVNDYEQVKRLREMLPPALTPAPGFAANGTSVVDHILSRHDGVKASGSCLSEILTSHSSGSPSPTSHLSSPTPKKISDAPKSPSSEGSDFGTLKIKDEIDDDFDEEMEGCGGTDEATTAYTIDENGLRRRIYVPMSERQAENYRCRYCTFIARDLKRLNCHERSHGMPPTRKERFKCMFCPQGFDSEIKFRLHITCHPGLIKFLLYRCKKCEFDTNQKHTIVKHITCNRDRKHRGFGPVEEHYTVISRALESRVLECERCDYMSRHKIHMAIHYQRKHNILRDKGEFTIESLTPTDTPVSSYDTSQDSNPSPINGLASPDSYDGIFEFPKPSSSSKKSKEKVSPDAPHLTSSEINERNELFNKMVSQQAALQPGQVLENQMRKFKCPICKYLLPKAADLKNHVKRHSEIGQITLVMFRCKYCSCMSTARELLYEHLNEKHLGKPIALVKKIVAIDTTEVDKSFAETSMEESLDQLEESLHKEIMTSLKKPSSSSSRSHKSGSSSSSSYEQLFVIPEGDETFSAPLQCPKCPFKSHNKSEIVHHVNSLHPEVKVIGSDEDVDKLAKATSEDIKHAVAISNHAGSPSKHSFTCQEEVLIVPDEQVFKEPALCSRCDFYTMLRRDMVIHLQKNHPDISVMGRNSYPVQVSTMGRRTGLVDESCVVGSGSLDAKIRCLYENYGTQMKCLICGSERPKKFFIHVHILRHLNVYLWKCAFCAHRGLQKYKMVDHIKKIHPGKAMSVRYIRVNVEAKVSQFLSQFNVIKNRKADLDEGRDLQDASSCEDSMDQTINDSPRSTQKSPCSSYNLGSEELDEKIRCLYDYSDGVFYKCIACPNQFQRKFAVHRHIIISHLKVALLTCGYCGLEGVEKHQMVDHILACHKMSPVNIQTLDVDLNEKVSEFLSKVAAGELTYPHEKSDENEFNELMQGSSGSSKFDYCNRVFKSLSSGLKSKFLASKLSKYKNAPHKSGSKNSAGSGKKYSSCVDPGVIMLGREALDKELKCLYQLRPTGQIRCLVCRWEFPRKYPLHRHIMLKHLKLNLVRCPYCSFEGVEKYSVTAHIKEDHKDMPVSIKYVQPDVKSRVKEFVNDMANLGGMSQDLIQKPKSRDSSPLVIPKMEKKDDDDEDDDEDYKEKRKMSSGNTQRGLVVAMFGKKKKSTADDIVVKNEVVQEEADDEVGSVYSKEGKEEEFHDEFDEDNYDEDEMEAEGGTLSPSHDWDTSDTKLPFDESYTPGSYRSPAGGKPKALDVITKIKVLKSKEGPITKFYCEQCKFTSLHRSNIVRHIYKIHEKYQTHTCPVCNYQTLSLMLMQKHVEKEHPGAKYKDDSFTLNPAHIKPRSKPLMGPLSFHKKRQKLINKKITPPSPAPIASSSTQGPKQYACAYCHYETNTQEDILKHTRVNHSQGGEENTKSPKAVALKQEDRRLSACWDGSKKAVKRKIVDPDGDGQYKRKKRFVFEKGDDLIQCGHCETKETSMNKMQEHINWDHPGMPFKAKRIPAWRFICKSCSVKTMATSKMKYHLNRHVNYRPYTCTNCGAFFPSPDQCRRHSRSQGHVEQYTYVRNVKKENKVEELLEGTRKLALQIQEEASKDPDFDISQTDTFIAKFQDTSTNLKRSAPTGSKSAKKAKIQNLIEGSVDDGSPRKSFGKSPQTVGIELDVTVKCYRCEFTATNVNDIKVHHDASHPDEKFLWTELDRGFTCDSTGEALPDCESVPTLSLDVGYTTRMTLGTGNSPMRFKCKTCDFSSCVIQAMKSHLKSHQPKGFICPYCSRSFSGKEKLMRHQYCLHKGQQLWVIHLRRAGVAGSTGIGKGKEKSVPAEKNSITPKKEPELSDKESTNLGKQMRQSHQKVTLFNCSECSYFTDSLYNFRLHTVEQHDEFMYKVRDASEVSSCARCLLCSSEVKNESDVNLHIDLHFLSSLYQCGYCHFIHTDRTEAQRHLSSCHDKLEPRMSEVEIDSKDKLKQLITGGLKKSPLLLNLSPEVVLEKIPVSVLSHLGCETDVSMSEEDTERSSAFEADLTSDQKLYELENAEDNDDESRLMVVEGIDEYQQSDDDSNIEANENDKPNDEQRNLEDSDNKNNPEHEVEPGIQEAQDDVLNMQNSESDMLIIQFGGIASKSNEKFSGLMHEEDGSSSYAEHQESMDVPSFMRSKDSTLLSAQQTDEQDEDDNNTSVGNKEEDEEDDDDDLDEVNFENDITLASPLPMISLGDGVSMSPSNIEKNDCSVSSSPDHSELLLDV
ncbi:hypothetical protein Btru_042133 [Bulinus truncatus]|nr:hypothetical protein Btru_042133 [Bulinus truncatus]